jgi:hypothetical protein
LGNNLYTYIYKKENKMAVTYSWGVTQMTKKTIGDLENVILHVRWTCIGTEGATGTEGRFVGATPLDFESGSSDEFVAFGDLTEELVAGWVSASVTNPNGGYWDHISEQIQNKIDEVDDASEEIGSEDLPWSTGSVTPTPVSGSGD